MAKPRFGKVSPSTPASWNVKQPILLSPGDTTLASDTYHYRFGRLILIAVCIFSASLRSLCGQNADAPEVSVHIAGPPGQTVMVTMRYYDQGQASKTFGIRYEIDPASSLSVEAGHDGVRVFVAIATNRPVEVTLQEGSTALDHADSNRPQLLVLSAGEVVESDDYQPPRALLDDQERKLARQFLGVFQSTPPASTADLVSPLPAANVQWQVLDAYCRALQEELGDLAPESTQLDGWLSWDGSFGARVVSGLVDFQHARCRFSLMTIDQKLVDVVPDCQSMPDDWFHGPRSEELYIEASKELVRQLFAGDIAAAHGLFSKRYHETVTPEALADLSQTLQQHYGSEISDVQLKLTRLGRYDAELESKAMTVMMAVDMAAGKRALAEVEFVFPCGPNTVAKGHLSGAHVHEAWNSADPQLVQITRLALAAVFGETELSNFVEHLHADVRSNFSEPRLEEISQKIQREWGTIDGEPDWDRWHAEVRDESLLASGPVPTAQGNIEAQVAFTAGKLVGLDLMGPTYAVSTTDLLDDVGNAGDTGQRFWQSLIEGEIEDAYRQLAPLFRQEFSQTELREIYTNGGFEELPALKGIQLDSVRYSTRIDRPLPIIVAAFYLATFEDQTTQSLFCEFLRNEQGEFELVTFHSNFEITFPVDRTNDCKQLIQDFLSGDPQSVLQWFQPDVRAEVNPDLLAAFQRRLQKVAGNEIELPDRVSTLHRYANGTRTTQISARVATAGKHLPFEATFGAGYLNSFYFTDGGLYGFAEELHDAKSLERLGHEFIRLWLKDGDMQQAAPRLVADLRNAGVNERLLGMRDDWIRDNGSFLLSEMVQWQASATANEVSCLFDIDFIRETKRCEIVFEVSAIDAHIVAIRPREP